MKLLVPVYNEDLVPAVCDAARAGGHIAAICNPDSGPGRDNTLTDTWRGHIASLRDSGAQILYYVDLVQWDGDQGIRARKRFEKPLDSLKTEMGTYIARYGYPTGWFFDDLWDHTPERHDILTRVAAYRGGFTVANPGNADAANTANYLGSGVNVLVTWEKPKYASKSQPGQWELDNASRIGVLALGETGYASALQVARMRNVNLFYATARTDKGADKGKTWDDLPAYFADMSQAVARVPSTQP